MAASTCASLPTRRNSADAFERIDSLSPGKVRALFGSSATVNTRRRWQRDRSRSRLYQQGGNAFMFQHSRSSPEHCHHRAAECERLAELATNLSTKQSYLRMADCWRRLADDRQFADEIDRLLNGEMMEAG